MTSSADVVGEGEAVAEGVFDGEVAAVPGGVFDGGVGVVVLFGLELLVEGVDVASLDA